MSPCHPLQELGDVPLVHGNSTGPSGASFLPAHMAPLSDTCCPLVLLRVMHRTFSKREKTLKTQFCGPAPDSP